ncbi:MULTISPECIES: nucleotidyltransferase domain-containing protein [unclassified Saccharothrix]|uniref:nucleotidyltransferase domain-containing protein n=1 Tax=unclassified Saccharothrix TaxID=2593673 RepID=UPI00307F966D
MLVLSVVVGSHAYGLATSQSDVDRRGVFVAPTTDFWRFDKPPTSYEGPRPEELNWEVERFCALALKANPTVLEVFASPHVEHATAVGRELRDLLPHVLSRQAVDSFARATTAQFTRALDRPKWKQLMHVVRQLLVCRDLVRTGVLSIDATPHRDRLLAIRRGEVPLADVEEWVNGLRADIAAAEGPLPVQPGRDAVEAWLVSVRRRGLA